MPAETCQENVPQAGEVPASAADALKSLQREMLRQTAAASSPHDLLHAFTALLERFIEPIAACYFQRDEQQELTPGTGPSSAIDQPHNERLAKQLLAACQVACRAGQVEVRQLVARECTLLAVPVARYGQDPAAVGLAVRSDLPLEQLVLLGQLMGSQFVLWHVVAEQRAGQGDFQRTAALVELLERVLQAEGLQHACYTLAGELQSLLQCQRVAVGLRHFGRGRCRLAAVSGMSQFDRRSASAQAIESALDESIVRQQITHWPAGDDSERHASLAHKNLCAREQCAAVASIPLRLSNQQVVGALVLFHDTPSALHEATAFLAAAETSIAAALASAQRAEGGSATRCVRLASGVWKTSKAKLAALAGLVALAAMWIPVPYRIHCDCVVEPVTRRFVAAPFESMLEKSLVKPGDLVREGDILARLDGRELRWQLAGVAADRQQALKRRDVAQATRSYADQQIAQLEIEQLDLELKLLEHREQNLEIRSPLPGIVASGELERAEGAPLTLGQTLFEIAPLDTMIVEVAIPDDEIAYCASGQKIDIRLDAFPGESWPAVATKIQPRSEIRDQQNVFIAEAELDNADGRLRPGMKGRAKVTTPTRTLGWVLFHRPWEYAAKKLNW